MFLKSLLRMLALCSLAVVAATGIAAAESNFVPKVGQEGKDVIWVPTPQSLVNRMLDMAKLRPGDFVIDLGSGDGRTVISAAKRGVPAMGIEFNPKMVALSRQNAEKAGVSKLATFVQGDFFKADLSRATVITMFLLDEINLKLRPKILDLKPGTRIVTNEFDFADWKPDQTVTETKCTDYCNAYLWIVPAKVAGTWKFGNGELKLQQKFQMISGTVRTGNVSEEISNAKVLGNVITFVAGTTHYTGVVNGNAIDGFRYSNVGWKATRGQ